MVMMLGIVLYNSDTLLRRSHIIMLKDKFSNLSFFNRLATIALLLGLVFAGLAAYYSSKSGDAYDRLYDIKIQNAGTTPNADERYPVGFERLDSIPIDSEYVYVPSGSWETEYDRNSYCNRFLVKKSAKVSEKYPNYLVDKNDCQKVVSEHKEQRSNYSYEAGRYSSYVSLTGITSAGFISLFALIIGLQLLLFLWKILVRETVAAIQQGKDKSK